MKNCPYCGSENPDDASYCSKCGNPFPESQSSNSAYGSTPNNPNENVYVNNHYYSDRGSNTGAYIGLTILFLMVGIIAPLICMLVVQDEGLKKYSRGWFIAELVIIAIPLFILLLAFCAAS